MRKRFIYAGILTLAIGVLTIAAYAAGKQMVKSDQMTGYQETPGVFSNGTGSFKAEIDDDTQVITFELRYTGLSAPAVVSHIHFGNRFDAGGVSVFFCGGGNTEATKKLCPASAGAGSAARRPSPSCRRRRAA